MTEFTALPVMKDRWADLRAALAPDAGPLCRSVLISAKDLRDLLAERDQALGTTALNATLFWDAGDMEMSHQSIEDVLDDHANLEPVRVARAASLPDIWAVRVPDMDDDGMIDGTEIRTFASEAEANAFIRDMKTPD